MMLQLMLLTMTFQQKVQALTRHHIMQRLIWVRTVCVMSHLWDSLLKILDGHALQLLLLMLTFQQIGRAEWLLSLTFSYTNYCRCLCCCFSKL